MTITEELVIEIRKMDKELQILRGALKIINEWKFPHTRRYWDEEKTRPMSYGAAFGSNGERDYMRTIAANALKRTSGTETHE